MRPWNELIDEATDDEIERASDRTEDAELLKAQCEDCECATRERRCPEHDRWGDGFYVGYLTALRDNFGRQSHDRKE